MKYTALEISNMRAILAELGYLRGEELERQLLTYMQNETTFEELREHFKNHNRVSFDYSRWNNTGRARKYEGNEVVGDEPFDYADYSRWLNAYRMEDDNAPSYTEWKASKTYQQEPTK